MTTGKTSVPKVLRVNQQGLTTLRYQAGILAPYIWLFQGAIAQDFFFMGANARPRKAGLVDDFLEGENIARMDLLLVCPT